MFQRERSTTTVPTRALLDSSPLAASVLMPSRSTGREIPNRSVNAASPGSFEPGGKSPLTIDVPIARATSAWFDRVRRAGKRSISVIARRPARRRV